MIDASMLPAPWRTVREVTTAGVLEIPAGVPVVVRNTWSGGFHQVRYGPVTLDSWFNAYRVFNNDGTTGPLVERTSTVTREWTEVPPNDETKVAVCYNDAVVTKEASKRAPDVRRADVVAWMLWSEWEAFLRGPRVAHVQVTAQDVDVADARADSGPPGYRQMADAINARLAARATAPVVTELEEFAWGLFRTVSVDDGSQQSTEWRRAVQRWCDTYYERRTAALASGVAP